MNQVRSITIENLQNKVPVSKSKISKLLLATLRYLKVKKDARINLYFVGNRKIKSLNRRYLKLNRATDVICFDISRTSKEILADIFISADTALSNAAVYHTSCGYELALYSVHGLLHLLGFDDATAQKSAAMHKKEKEILKQCLSVKPKR